MGKKNKSAQEEGAQMLQDRINSGDLQQTQDAAKIAEQLAISRGEAPKVPNEQEHYFNMMQNQFGTNNGNQAVNTDVTIQTERKPEYLLDWNTVGTLRDAYNKLGGVLPHKIIKDRERWGIENNKPIDYTEIVDMIPQGHSINKTKEENEAEEKKLRGQERMEKFANFLKHLGNFVGAAGWGGSVQGLEHPKELTARQQALRDKTEALRSAYNKSYFENYYKQRADEVSQQKMKIAQQQQDRLDAQQYLNERRFELDDKIKTGTLDLKKLEFDLKKAVAENKMSYQSSQIALAWARNELNKVKEARQASGTVTETHKKDKYGNDEVVRVEKKPGNAANNSNTSGNSLGIHVNKGGGNSLGIHVNKK